MRQNFVYHAMALKAALSFKRFRDDIDSKMSLSAPPMPGMAFMVVRFIVHLEALGREGLGQLLFDIITGSHGVPLNKRAAALRSTTPAGFEIIVRVAVKS